ncbi:MAG: site-2 protease family protein, partial [Candidatus Omnitrophica bacterium]|nr:site-2 protease family protein [Candidatus Omnitrophota bacterium]
MNFLAFFFIVGILIMVHELGHFLSALKLGVKVEKFSLGFGKIVFKYKRKDTEYFLGLIPFGGYVKLAGDNQEEYKGMPYEYLSQSVGRRFLIVFSGPFLNYLLGILLFWLIFFIGYPTLTTKIGKVLEGFGAEEAGLKKG